MAQKLIAPIAPDIKIGGHVIVRFAAVDPVTGADVTGVTVSAVNVGGETQGRPVKLNLDDFRLATTGEE